MKVISIYFNYELFHYQVLIHIYSNNIKFLYSITKGFYNNLES